MKFGEKLKIIRESRNMNITEFAKFLGTSKQNISRYELGEISPTLKKATEFADKLHISIIDLVDEDITLTAVPALDPQERQLITCFRRLNASGQEKLLDYAADLDASGRYEKEAGSSASAG